MLRWICGFVFGLCGTLATLFLIAVKVVDWSTRPGDALDLPNKAVELLRWLQPVITTATVAWATLAVSSLGLFLVVAGPAMRRRLQGSPFGQLIGLKPDALVIDFVEPAEESVFGHPNYSVQIVIPQKPDEARMRPLFLRRVFFTVRNQSSNTIEGLTATVEAIVDKNKKRQQIFRPIKLRLATVDQGVNEVNLRAGDSIRLILLEAIEELNGPAKASCLLPKDDLLKWMNGRNPHLALVGGIAYDRPIPKLNELELGVALHARNTTPVYGWFRLDLEDQFKVGFRTASSLR